jgi:chemotaxis protein CheX
MATTSDTKLRAEWVNPFLIPAKHVWEHELQTDLELVNAELVSYQFTTEDLTAVIGVSGKLEGNVLYGFSDDCAKNVVAKMLEEESVTEIDHMGLSALGEIANMITGNAATLLAQNGFPCEISPPVIIEPAGSRFTTVNAAQILVTFKSEMGTLRIRISLSENHRLK